MKNRGSEPVITFLLHSSASGYWPGDRGPERCGPSVITGGALIYIF